MSSVLPLNPSGLCGEVLPRPTVRFVGTAPMMRLLNSNGKGYSKSPIWTGRYHPG